MSKKIKKPRLGIGKDGKPQGAFVQRPDGRWVPYGSDSPETKECVLCGAPRDFIGQCPVPAADAKRQGVPDGKVRVHCYGICNQCVERPDFEDEVDAKIRDSLPN